MTFFFFFFLVGQPAIYHHPLLLNKTAVEVQMESDMKTKGKFLLDWCSPNNKQIQQNNSKVHTETWRKTNVQTQEEAQHYIYRYIALKQDRRKQLKEVKTISKATKINIIE